MYGDDFDELGQCPACGSEWPEALFACPICGTSADDVLRTWTPPEDCAGPEEASPELGGEA